MKEKNSLSGLTAEQMKSFAIVYARACLKGLIPDTSYKVLCLLCNIVTIICQPVLAEDDLTCLYRLLHDHHSAYCRLWKISSYSELPHAYARRNLGLWTTACILVLRL